MRESKSAATGMLRRKVCEDGSNQPTSNEIAFPEAKPNTLTSRKLGKLNASFGTFLHLVFFLTSIGLSQCVQRLASDQFRSEWISLPGRLELWVLWICLSRAIGRLLSPLVFGADTLFGNTLPVMVDMVQGSSVSDLWANPRCGWNCRVAGAELSALATVNR